MQNGAMHISYLMLMLTVLLSVVFAAYPFITRRHVFSRGLRAGSIVTGIAGLAWSTLRFTLLRYGQEIQPATAALLGRFEVLIAGFGIGCIITLFLVYFLDQTSHAENRNT